MKMHEMVPKAKGVTVSNGSNRFQERARGQERIRGVGQVHEADKPVRYAVLLRRLPGATPNLQRTASVLRRGGVLH
jgi:hypothetical protein